MNGEKVFQAITDLEDRYIEEAICYAPGNAAGAPGRTVHMKKKRIITLALAAALLLALGVGAYAANVPVVTSPQEAKLVVLEQIELWKEMGILSPDVAFDGIGCEAIKHEEEQGGLYWYKRVFPSGYDVRWYSTRSKFSGEFRLDAKTGKIIFANISARPDKNLAPLDEVQVELPIDPGDLSKGYEMHTSYFYNNYDDIFPAELTVGQFCELLAEYWGFSGYELSDTYDDLYGKQEAVDEAMLLRDIPKLNPSNYYITVFFEGDQTGVPMYIQLCNFCDYVSLLVGTNHGVG